MRRAAWMLLLAVTLAGAQHPPAAPDPAKVEAATKALERGEQLLAAGKLDEALAQLRAAKASIPAEATWLTVRAMMLDGLCQFAQGNAKAAEATFAAVIEQFADWPEGPDALNYLGRAQMAQNRDKEARASYYKLLALAPHSQARYAAETQLLNLDLKAGDLAAAEARLKGLQKSLPCWSELPYLQGDLATALAGKGQPAAALTWLETIRRECPGSAAAQTARRPQVEALLALKRTDEALKLLDEVVAQAPEQQVVASAATLRVEVLTAAGQWEAAVAVLAALAQRYPASSVALEAVEQQSELLRKHDRFDEAVAQVTAVAAAFHGNWWRAQTLPVRIGALRAKQDWDKAEDALAELVKLTEGTPTAAQALLDMAEVQRAAGRKKAARATLDKIVQTYKGPPVVPLAMHLAAEWEKADKAAPN
ncbi:MAG: tetratricopeptide repeat protein [Fimbriimonadaceae bacterium]|nr:tetratricopeptide repeat protein [Fimbriimonadaceae bacterium]